MDLSYRLERTNRNSSDQAAWIEMPNGPDGCKECRTGRNAIIHKHDDTVGKHRQLSALTVEMLPSSDLLLLHAGHVFNVCLGKMVRRHCLGIQENVSGFIDAPSAYSGSSGAPSF